MVRPPPRPLAAAALALALLAACGGRGKAAPPAAGMAPPVAAPEPPAPGPPPHVLLAEARAAREAGDHEGARARLEAALAAVPWSDAVRVELADLLLADGRDVARAGEILGAVRQREGRRYHLLAAHHAELSGDDASAAARYGLALEEQPDPDIRLRRALSLERAGRPEEAVAELALVRDARPADVSVRTRLAALHESAGRLPDAEAELVAAARANPGRGAGWVALARFYERTGRPDEARRALERARATAPPERVLRPLRPSAR
jgi:thioredoxin-like negative regulator of GroEL